METLLKTPNLGTGVLEDRDRVNFPVLRQARADRVFDMMDRLGLDACVFGREANVRYVSGARRLWTALSRPFAPTCVVLRNDRSTHLLSFSASYEGIPEELQPDDMYPLSWNPLRVVDHVRSLPGAGDVRRVGVDGMTSLFDGLLRLAFPDAEMVGIQPEVTELRRVKLDAEVTCLRIAAGTAEAALVAAIGKLTPGVTGKQLQGAYLARMSVLGTSQFAQQGTFSVLDRDEPHFETTADPVPDGAAVALAGGVLWSGYEGSLARTWWCGRGEPPASQRALGSRWRSATGEVVDACRPGATGTTLLAKLATDQVDLRHSAVYWIGLGHEGVVAADWLPARAMDHLVLQANMVLGVRLLIRDGGGAHLGEEMVLVAEDGPELVTTLEQGALVP